MLNPAACLTGSSGPAHSAWMALDEAAHPARLRLRSFTIAHKSCMPPLGPRLHRNRGVGTDQVGDMHRRRRGPAAPAAAPACSLPALTTLTRDRRSVLPPSGPAPGLERPSKYASWRDGQELLGPEVPGCWQPAVSFDGGDSQAPRNAAEGARAPLI